MLLRHYLVPALLAVTLSVRCQAGVLTFDGNICSTEGDGSGSFVACSNDAKINQGYGDSTGVNFTFQENDVNSAGSLSVYLDWNGDTVAYSYANSTIQMTADPGYSVTLNSFRLVPYYGGYMPGFVQVWQIGGASPLLDFALPITFDTPVTFSPGSTSSSGLEIRYYNLGGNFGIDDIDFTVTAGSGVPEPASLGLAGAALAGLLATLRRRAVR